MPEAPRKNDDLETRLARASDAWSTAEPPAASPPFAEAPRRNFVVEFLAENWLWIVVPALLVIAALGGTALYLSMTNEGDATTPFIYATYD